MTLMDNFHPEVDTIEDEVQNLIDGLGDLQSETEGNLENMPEQLRDGDTGQLLQERIDGLGDFISALEGMDFSELEEEGKTEEEKERILDDLISEVENNDPGF